MSEYLLALDAGTTSITVAVYDRQLLPVARFSSELTQHYPRTGWVEHDAIEIAESAVGLLRRAIEQVGAGEIAALGITNQRETVLPLDRKSGEPLHRAIVWQCRRTAARCAELRTAGREALIRARTGLTLDPYFSASKMEWLIRNVGTVAEAAREKRLAFATVDTWLVHVLGGGSRLVTEPTNAARTMLYDLQRGEWSLELARLFSLSLEMLPEVLPSAGDFGTTSGALVGAEIPIRGVVGDQQAALFAHRVHREGIAKNTYGTGGFLLTPYDGDVEGVPGNLLMTAAVGESGESILAVEGSVFVAGAAIQWLRDELGVIGAAVEVEHLAREVPDTEGLVFVPAFVGLGAPYWDSDVRGTLLGITRGTRRAHLARATLEAIAHQTEDLLETIRAASSRPVERLHVDGGAARCDLLMQMQADLSRIEIVRPRDIESTARGAAALAGLALGWELDSSRERALEEQVFRPAMPIETLGRKRGEWKRAVACARSFTASEGGS